MPRVVVVPACSPFADADRLTEADVSDSPWLPTALAHPALEAWSGPLPAGPTAVAPCATPSPYREPWRQLAAQPCTPRPPPASTRTRTSGSSRSTDRPCRSLSPPVLPTTGTPSPPSATPRAFSAEGPRPASRGGRAFRPPASPWRTPRTSVWQRAPFCLVGAVNELVRAHGEEGASMAAFELACRTFHWESSTAFARIRRHSTAWRTMSVSASSNVWARRSGRASCLVLLWSPSGRSRDCPRRRDGRRDQDTVHAPTPRSSPRWTARTPANRSRSAVRRRTCAIEPIRWFGRGGRQDLRPSRAERALRSRPRGPRTGRGRRGDPAVELPARHDRMEGRTRPDRGQLPAGQAPREPPGAAAFS